MNIYDILLSTEMLMFYSGLIGFVCGGLYFYEFLKRWCKKRGLMDEYRTIQRGKKI